MKKLALALAATAAFAGQAFAADMAARMPVKAAPMAAPVASWTGCYLGAGGGGAYTTNDNYDYTVATGVPFTGNQTNGARGWFGTVQGGCDYQIDRFVIGAFADYDFMDVKGDKTVFFNQYGSQKQDWQWAVGGRVGYLIVPQLLSYFSAGYTQAHWKQTDYTPFGGAAPAFTIPGATRGGWFIGAGDEYALSFMPGLFWKTEYRYSEFDRRDQAILNFGTNTLTGFGEVSKVREHSVRSELVYRFNWGGPVVAKY